MSASWSRALAFAALAFALAPRPQVQAGGRGVTDTSASPHVRFRSVDIDAVRWTGGFWAGKFRVCRDAMLPCIHDALRNPRNAAVLGNFRVAAGLEAGKHLGRDWGDGDCYKWLEAVAWVYAATRDPKLDRLLDGWIAVIAKAQADDGYLSTNIQLSEKGRFTNTHHHELYNMGHLLTAACVHHRVTGKDTFLAVARKLGDFLCRTFQPRPPALAHYGWNPSNIMGLAALYRTTGDRRYLDLARIFVDMRGSSPGGSDLTQDRVPLREETEAVGHAVCATYLYCGAADVLAEARDDELLAALLRIWDSATRRRMYITGAVGSFHQGRSTRGDPVHEAFGADYELPPRTAYAETCSNIGNAMWNWRLLALTADARHADVMERVLYNSALSAVALDGRGFFYCNPLEWKRPTEGLSKHHTPQRWAVHSCYCCPPQVARTVAKLRGWVYSVGDDGVWVHLFGGSRLQTALPGGGTVTLVQETDYPWDGKVRLVVREAGRGAFALRVRIPGWAEGPQVRVNGKPFRGRVRSGHYLACRHQWERGDSLELDLPMPVRFVEAHPKVVSCRGRVAVMRGPLVYCLESIDLPDGVDLDAVRLPRGLRLAPRRDPALLGGAVVLEGEARAEGRADPVPIRLIPYHLWANRGETHMAVWLPRGT